MGAIKRVFSFAAGFKDSMHARFLLCLLTVAAILPAAIAVADSTEGVPETKIEYGPRALTNDPEPTFGYSSSDFNAGFECSVDDAPFTHCTSNKVKIAPALADGPHSFAVRAVAQSGVIDPTPASRRFTVDATAPRVMILSGPSGRIRDRRPRFTFEAAGADRVECALVGDRAEIAGPRFGPCTSARAYRPPRPLADDGYSFSVRATDSAGNVTERSRRFVLRTSPGHPPNPYADSTLYIGRDDGIRIAIRVKGRRVILVDVVARLSCVGPKGRLHSNRIRKRFAEAPSPLEIGPNGVFRSGPERVEEPSYSFEEGLRGRVGSGAVVGSVLYVENEEYRDLRCQTGSRPGAGRPPIPLKFRAERH